MLTLIQWSYLPRSYPLGHTKRRPISVGWVASPNPCPQLGPLQSEEEHPCRSCSTPLIGSTEEVYRLYLVDFLTAYSDINPQSKYAADLRSYLCLKLNNPSRAPRSNWLISECSVERSSSRPSPRLSRASRCSWILPLRGSLSWST